MECLVTKKRPIAMGCQFQSGLTFTPALPAVVWLWDQPSAKLSVRQTGKKKHEKSLPQCWKSKRMAFCKPSFFGSKQSIFGWCFRCFQRNDLRYNVDIFFCRSSLKNILCICVHICIYISYIHAPCQSAVSFAHATSGQKEFGATIACGQSCKLLMKSATSGGG